MVVQERQLQPVDRGLRAQVALENASLELRTRLGSLGEMQKRSLAWFREQTE